MEPAIVIRGWPSQPSGVLPRAASHAGGPNRHVRLLPGVLSLQLAQHSCSTEEDCEDYDDGYSSDCWSSDYDDAESCRGDGPSADPDSGAGDEPPSSASCSCSSTQPVPIPPFKEPTQRAWALARYHLQQLAAHHARREVPDGPPNHHAKGQPQAAQHPQHHQQQRQPARHGHADSRGHPKPQQAPQAHR